MFILYKLWSGYNLEKFIRIYITLIYMPEKFVQEIRQIDGLPDYISKDVKDELMRAAWDEWSGRNTVVRDVKEDKTTFLKEYTEAFDAYDSERVFLPHLLPEGFEENVVDLEACIGDSSLEEGINTLLQNPLAGIPVAIGAAGIGLGFSYKWEEKPSRRAFLKVLIGMGLFGGASIGGQVSITTGNNLNTIKENAIYLDQVHTKYIR